MPMHPAVKFSSLYAGVARSSVKELDSARIVLYIGLCLRSARRRNIFAGLRGARKSRGRPAATAVRILAERSQGS
jgi:hypothetical protein